MPLRGVFKPDDAWLATGDLFREDEDGDFWLVGSAATLIRTATGMVAPRPIENALSDIDWVDLAVAYGVPDPEGEHEARAGRRDAARGQGARGRQLTGRWRGSDRTNARASSGRRRNPSHHLVPPDLPRAARAGDPEPGPGVWELGDDGEYSGRLAG